MIGNDKPPATASDGARPVTLALEGSICCLCGSGCGTTVATGRDYEYQTCENSFHFVCCDQCNHVYLNPRPSLTDLSVIYPNTYYSFSVEKGGFTQRVWDRLEKRKIDNFRKVLGDREEAVIYELGCGSGRLLKLMRRYLPASWRIQGIEIDSAAAALANQIKGVSVGTGLFEDAPIESASVDMIIAQQVIEHVPDPRKILEKAARVIKPGGILILETPNVLGLDRRLFKETYWGGYHFPRHFNLFSPEGIAHLATQCGFEQARALPLLSVTFWITTINNVLADHPRAKRWFPWCNIRNPICLGLTTCIELLLRLGRSPSSNMQLIAVR